MAKITKALEKRLDKMKPDETILTRVNTTNIDKMEKDFLIFNIRHQLTSDYQGYFAELTAQQVRHFAEGEYPYITSIIEGSLIKY